jgi:YVTN family beta-propeller protein
MSLPNTLLFLDASGEVVGRCFDGSYVYVCNSNGTVSVINPSTLTVKATITVGSYPFSCCYDGSYVYVCNQGSGSNGTVAPNRSASLGCAGQGKGCPGVQDC